MFNFSEATPGPLSVHHLGVKSAGEDIKISHQPIQLDDEEQRQIMSYFFNPFKDPEFYHFSFTDGDHVLNPLYNYAANIFDDPDAAHEYSVHIARYLFEQSSHPNIKPGHLLVCHLQDVLIDDEMTEVIAVFKAESQQSFMQFKYASGEFEMDLQDGIHLQKVDKACIIINTMRDEGFKLCIVDRSNQTEAQYWKHDFLHAAPLKNNFFTTTHYIQATKNYIKERLPFEEGADRLDEAEILNRSKKYLDQNETFDKATFEQEVFRQEQLRSSFHSFVDDYEAEKGVTLEERFDISTEAVKKKNKVFKSVLKLDKNFHVYIHGDRSKIERIVEPDGSKYYKIYFDQEH